MNKVMNKAQDPQPDVSLPRSVIGSRYKVPYRAVYCDTRSVWVAECACCLWLTIRRKLNSRVASMNPFTIKIESNIGHAQGFGHWLYIQLGEFALRVGRGMPFGVRFVWSRSIPRLEFRRFK